MNERYKEAATAYNELIAQAPNSEGIGFAVSGLVRCYEALGRKSEITSLLDELIAKYSGTTAAISAREHSLPFLLQEGSLEKGLARAKELWELNRGHGLRSDFSF